METKTIFLTNENDFDLTDIRLACFYSSELDEPFNDILFSTIKQSSIKGNILCIDLAFYKSFVKRFKLVECPTLILLVNGKEEMRISGFKDLKPIKE